MAHISKLSILGLSAALALTVGACSKPKTEAGNVDAPKKVEKIEKVEKTQTPAVQAVSLDELIAHPRRNEASVRDQFRNPKETLEFFGIEPSQTVIEIWPGWYTDIIAPYLASGGGQYVAVLLPEGISQSYDDRRNRFLSAYSDSAIYGDIAYGAFGKDSYTIAADGSADVVLTFRNVHNWMKGGYAQEAFNGFYAALKPGGILGLVEHRLPESAEQDPKGQSGYVQESYMKDLAAKAGFEFVASSEVNANPKDTADHPFGVWTLPPRSRVGSANRPAPADFNPELYKNIGESDRATLKFRKPL